MKIRGPFNSLNADKLNFHGCPQICLSTTIASVVWSRQFQFLCVYVIQLQRIHLTIYYLQATLVCGA